MINNYTINNKKYNKIYHISDLHIRINSRIEEYTNVFNNTINFIKEDKNDNSIAVITGDLLHDKHKFKPITYHLLGTFLKNLSDNIEVIIITGNHDMNEKNLSQIDSLSPICNHLPVHYLNKSGNYKFGNFIFTVSSLTDQQFIKYNDIDKDFIKNCTSICLYHGAIVGSKLDNGTITKNHNYTHTSRYRNLNDFKGFDAVLLGDIHKFQFLKKNIAYSGSLLQQNFGETIDNHGVLIWNFNKEITTEFKHIKNEHCFYNFKFVKNKFMNPPKLLTKYINCKLHLIDSDDSCVDFLKKKYRDHIFESITINNKYSLENTNITIDEEAKIHQDDIYILENILNNTELNTTDKTFIMDIHKKNKIAFKNIEMNSQIWKINSIQFKNLFIFGKDHDNTIKFKKGLNSICAPNNYGKTSILKIILFSLFDNLKNCGRTKSFINNLTNKDNSSVSSNITIGDKSILIEKTSKSSIVKKIKKYSFDMNLFGYLPNCNEKINMNEPTKLATNKKFQYLIGDEDVFYYLNVCSNKFCKKFIFESPEIRTKLLRKLFKLHHYEKYFSETKDTIKKINTQVNETNGIIKMFKSEINEIDCDLLTNDLQKNKLKLIQLNKEKSDNKEILKKLNNKKNICNKKIKKLFKNIKNDKSDINDIDSKINKLKQFIDLSNIINSNKLQSNINKLISQKKYVEDCDIDDIKNKLNEFSDFKFIDNPFDDCSNDIQQSVFKIKFLKKQLPNIIKKKNMKFIEIDDDKIDNLKSQIINVPDNCTNKLMNFNKNLKKLKYIELDCDDLIKRKYELEQLIGNSSDITVNDFIFNKFNEFNEKLNDEIYEIMSFKVNGSICLTYSNEPSTKRAQFSRKINKSVFDEHVSWLSSNSYTKEYESIINNINYDKIKSETLEYKKHVINHKNNIKINKQIIKLNKQIDINKYIKLTEEIKSIENDLDKLNEIQSKFIKQKEFNDLYKTLDNLEFNVDIDKNIMKLQKQIKYNKLIDIKNDNESYIKIEKLEKELNKYNKEIDEINFDNIILNIQNTNNLINEIKNNIKNYNKNLTKLNDSEEKLSIMQHKLDLLNIYKNAVNKHGIPAELISEKIKYINLFVNNFVKKFLNLSISVTYEAYGNIDKKGVQKSGVFISISKNNKTFDVSNLGGFESWLVNLAFKISLNRFSFYTKSSFIIIDEELDCIDTINFDKKLPLLISTLKKYYHTIIAISHRNLEQYSDYKIIINNDGESSYL